ncbi:MAG: hypothetical protein ABIX01_02295 [Chitinophagaceae bacterium]
MDERMALIDLIWEVTDEENPEWKDERSEEEILAESDGDADEGPPSGK